MAITITSSPGAYSSASDSMWVVCTSTNSTQSSFKYVFDLQVSGTTVATIKVFPDQDGYGVLDTAPIIRNYFSSTFIPSGSGLLQGASAGLQLNYTVNFGEEYGGTTYLNLTTGSYAAYQYILNPYRTSLSSFANKFLTTRDKTQAKVMSGEKFFVTFFNADLANVTATIQKLNEDGTNNGSSSTGSGISTAQSLLLDLSPTAINSYLGTSFITDSTYAYNVTIAGDTIKLFQTCAPRFTPVYLVFQNAYGGYDTMAFRLLSRNSKKFNHKNYDSVDYVRSGGTMNFKDSYNRYYGGMTNFATSIDQSFKVISDYLSVTDYNWSSELLASNEVYYCINGDYYPITFQTQTWEEKNYNSDKMFNLELMFDLGKTTYAQFR